MNTILIIPHGTDPNLKVRGSEIAKTLAGSTKATVYYVCFSRPRDFSFISKLTFFVSQSVRKITIQKVDSHLYYLYLPYLYLPYTKMTYPLIRFWANIFLRKAIRTINPNVVINASYLSYAPKKSRHYTLIYDLVDDFLGEGSLAGWLHTNVKQFVVKNLREADEIWTISMCLKDKLQGLGYPNAHYYPNGFRQTDFKKGNRKEVGKVLDTYNLHGKKVIGFIGNHGHWSGLDFVIELSKVSPPDWVYFVVGGGEEVPKYRNAGLSNVIFTGPIPVSQISYYYGACDIGILPFIKNNFTDNALPLKVLEYGAANKIVVAEKLNELTRIDLEYIRFPKKRHALNWIDEIGTSLRLTWDPKWSSAIARFDWSTIFSKLDYTRRPTIGFDARPLAYPLSGVGQFLFELIHKISEKQWNIVLFSNLDPIKEYADYLKRYHVKWVIHKTNQKWYWELITLKQMIKNNPVDVYHAVNNQGIPLRANVRSVLTLHDLITLDPIQAINVRDKVYQRTILKFLTLLSFRKADRVITGSISAKKEISRMFAGYNKPVSVIYDGLKTRIYPELKKGTWALNSKLPFLLYFGGFDRRKNVELIISAFEKLNPVNNLQLILAGDHNAYFYRHILPLVVKSTQKNNMVCPGYVSDQVLNNLIVKANAVLYLSRAEGFGLPIIMAQAVGTRIIASAIPTSIEVAGREAILVPLPTTPEIVAEKMKTVLQHQKLRPYVDKRFDWDWSCEKYSKIYLKLIKDHREKNKD